MSQDELYIQRCLELAEKGRYTVAPNPMVGAVIVHQGKIIAEGYHHHPGGPHAEVVAISRVKNPELLKESCIYVSLEPCSHFGKTPPCSDLIIEKGIPEVVIASRDYNAEVNGKGIAKLQAAGITVREGILEAEALELNRRFFTFHREHRPYISLKWAQSADGIMDPDREAQEKGIQWISQPETQVFTHRLRAENQAILVGRKTVEIDNPSLDCRAFEGADPLRIVLDPSYQLGSEYRVFRDQNYLRFSRKAENERDRVLEPNSDSLSSLIKTLYEEGIQSLLIEGGAHTLQSFIDAGLWDEAWIIKANHDLKSGLSAPKIKGQIYDEFKLGKDLIQNLRPL
ncbi:bifunctional diaminohydroxyphosphoribosylaminopyrimidine deaminase/5-amino-6-(5-phosphoribosylamino)uracil reductase RibD [Croceimicrobium sp.]|uniref:bifunctional diaminohydroxyphosphoribosylaminopyrimidine deaminase/5-amino-6-(5-phosphoribosylamino)uracil reductase RibD n=1 Tax=Croceimicrobium sp. TaxID=2828340 RepID=UPI003BAD537A